MFIRIRRISRIKYNQKYLSSHIIMETRDE